MKKTTALFDLDGVLIDSEGLYTDFWAEIGRKFQLTSPTFAHDIKGRTLNNILNEYFSAESAKTEIIKELHSFEDNMEFRIFPGAEELLRDLRLHSVGIAIVTSSDDKKMEYLFRQQPALREMVDIVIDGSMVSKSKPDPEGYLTAARKLGGAPADAFVFEDSFQGLEAGRRAGATVIAVATTNPAESLKGKAHAVIDGLAGFSYNQMIEISKL